MNRVKDLVQIFGENTKDLLKENKDLLDEGTMSDFEQLRNMANKYSADILDVLEFFFDALKKNEHSASEIVSLYSEDERHLEYLAGDPHDIFLYDLENCDQNLYKFVLDNNYLDEDDMQDITEDLNETQLMDFNLRIGANEECSSDVDPLGDSGDMY